MPYSVKNEKSASIIEAHGNDIKEVFTDGARGMLSIAYDIEQIKGDDSIEITAQASDNNALFQAWIQELFDRAALQDVAIVEVEVHTIQKINQTDILLTATAWTAPLESVKEHATGTTLSHVKKSSSSCNEKSGAWQCEITVSTTS